MEEPGAKFIVFSQFVSFLDLTQHRLASAGVRCVKLEGSMTVQARDRVIDTFRADPHCTVFLMSLKAGGVSTDERRWRCCRGSAEAANDAGGIAQFGRLT